MANVNEHIKYLSESISNIIENGEEGLDVKSIWEIVNQVSDILIDPDDSYLSYLEFWNNTLRDEISEFISMMELTVLSRTIEKLVYFSHVEAYLVSYSEGFPNPIKPIEIAYLYRKRIKKCDDYYANIAEVQSIITSIGLNQIQLNDQANRVYGELSLVYAHAINILEISKEYLTNQMTLLLNTMPEPYLNLSIEDQYKLAVEGYNPSNSKFLPKWSSTLEEARKPFYDLLLEEEFLDTKTDFNSFSKFFSGTTLPNNSKTLIYWKDAHKFKSSSRSGVGSLSYIIYWLEKYEIISIENRVPEHTDIRKTIFANYDYLTKYIEQPNGEQPNRLRAQKNIFTNSFESIEKSVLKPFFIPS